MRGHELVKRLLGVLARPPAGVTAALLFGGSASLARGTDATWDLRNYHFYNPWALLHGRLYLDYAPAQIQTYLNPLPDLPFYALVRAEMPAPFIAFFTGLPFGLAVYFFCRIVHRVTLDVGVRRQALALFAICAVARIAARFLQIGRPIPRKWN